MREDELKRMLHPNPEGGQRAAQQIVMPPNIGATYVPDLYALDPTDGWLQVVLLMAVVQITPTGPSMGVKAFVMRDGVITDTPARQFQFGPPEPYYSLEGGQEAQEGANNPPPGAPGDENIALGED